MLQNIEGYNNDRKERDDYNDLVSHRANIPTPKRMCLLAITMGLCLAEVRLYGSLVNCDIAIQGSNVAFH